MSSNTPQAKRPSDSLAAPLEALAASPASPEIKALTSSTALLHPDPHQRMKLKELLQRFPLVEDGDELKDELEHETTDAWDGEADPEE